MHLFSSTFNDHLAAVKETKKVNAARRQVLLADKQLVTSFNNCWQQVSHVDLDMPRKPGTALKCLDVHMVCSKKFSGVANGLKEALAYMFVDVDVSLTMAITEGDTGLTVHVAITLQSLTRKFCRIMYKEELPLIPTKKEIKQRLYEFILKIQNEKKTL